MGEKGATPRGLPPCPWFSSPWLAVVRNAAACVNVRLQNVRPEVCVCLCVWFRFVGVVRRRVTRRNKAGTRIRLHLSPSPGGEKRQRPRDVEHLTHRQRDATTDSRRDVGVIGPILGIERRGAAARFHVDVDAARDGVQIRSIRVAREHQERAVRQKHLERRGRGRRRVVVVRASFRIAALVTVSYFGIVVFVFGSIQYSAVQ